MKKIQILGPGCPRCETLTENVERAVGELGLDVEVEKVTRVVDIARMGVVATPALAVDGKVESSGHLLSVRQVRELLERQPAGDRHDTGDGT